MSSQLCNFQINSSFCFFYIVNIVTKPKRKIQIGTRQQDREVIKVFIFLLYELKSMSFCIPLVRHSSSISINSHFPQTKLTLLISVMMIDYIATKTAFETKRNLSLICCQERSSPGNNLREILLSLFCKF